VPAGGELTRRPVHAAFSLRQRANYALSEYVMWHPAARLVGLFAAAAIVIYLAAFAYRLCDPSGKEADAPIWLALRGYLSPMDNDFQDNKLRALSVCLALAGTVLFGILVGVVTESVESTIARADSGLSNVVVSGHTLICGWNGNTASVVRDLHALGGKRRIVLLVSAEEKDRVMDELRDVFTEQQKRPLKISVRSGTPLFPGDLTRVAASHAKKIILVSDQNVSAADSDRRILARALALKTYIPSFSGEVVAELSSSREKAALTSILKSTNTQSVQAISSERLLYRFMAQAVRQKGLADIVSKLMGTDSKTIFRVLPVSALARNLVGMNFAAIRPTVVPGCIICGFVDESTGNAVLSTASSKIPLPTLTPSTRLLVLGEPSGSVSSSVSRTTILSPVTSPTDSILSRRPRIKSTAENILICGWRPDIREMLTELDGMLHSGSRITILDESAPDPTVEYKFKNIAVTSIRKRPDRFANLKELLQPSEKPYDRVLVLSMALKGDVETGLSIGDVEQDSLVLSTICWLSELLGEPSIQRPTTLTVEFAHDQVGDVVRKDSTVTNSIQPYSLSARISAQTVRDSRLNEVWSELLQQRGREVYIRPISSYIDPVKQVLSFATISDQSALQRDELVVGYVPKDGEAVINPDGPLRYNSRKWSQDDRLIVIALD
jgi:ion channel POLLUX/CASTOR